MEIHGRLKCRSLTTRCNHVYDFINEGFIGGYKFKGYKCAKCGHELADQVIGDEESDKREV